MSELAQIVSVIVVFALVIGLMVGWCLGAWRNRVVYRAEDTEPYGEASTYRRDR